MGSNEQIIRTIWGMQMQLIEAYRLQSWVDEEINQRQIPQKLSDLLGILNQIVNAGNQPRPPFSDQQGNYNVAALAVNFSRLSIAQAEVIDTLGIAENVGSSGVEKLDEILSSTIDIATAAGQVNEMAQALNDGVAKVSAIAQALAPLVDDEPTLIEPGQVLARFVFENDAAIDDIDKLRRWSEKLFHIGRGFAMAHNEAPQSVRVVGAISSCSRCNFRIAHL